MSTLHVTAWAKVNLALDIVARRPDGYHNIETVMHRIDLGDEIEITRTKRQATAGRIDVQVHAESPLAAMVPAGKDNIAYRSVLSFCEGLGCDAAREWDINVEITKRIPASAGLGGGSADAAAVLAALNVMWGNPYGEEALMKKASSIGADVPFCMYAMGEGSTGAAVAKGIGEVIRPVPSLPRAGLVLAVTPFGLSTKDMYSMWDEQANKHQRSVHEGTHAAQLAGAMERGRSLQELCHMMWNDFQQLAVVRRPEVKQLGEALVESGAITALLTGSGPTVFGVFESFHDACEAAESSLLRQAVRRCAGAELLAVSVGEPVETADR